MTGNVDGKGICGVRTGFLAVVTAMSLGCASTTPDPAQESVVEAADEKGLALQYDPGSFQLFQPDPASDPTKPYRFVGLLMVVENGDQLDSFWTLNPEYTAPGQNHPRVHTWFEYIPQFFSKEDKEIMRASAFGQKEAWEAAQKWDDKAEKFKYDKEVYVHWGKEKVGDRKTYKREKKQ